jgi:DNA modification methylase
MLLRGDCLELLRGLPDCSVDSVVTDPPYELGFMGKRWDASGVAYSVELWGECLRVLKPGGHLLAFGGTRTYHRMVVAIEDAGFEIRDSIHWIYGSGFPKSLDVSKAIDKVNGEQDRLHKFTAWMRTTGLSARQIDTITGTNMGGHYLTAKSQPAIPTAELWAVIRPYCGDVPGWVDELVARVEAERVIVGTRDVPIGHSFAGPTYGGDSSNKEVAVTAPATPEAQRWSGWGTALKPAHEPVVVARKPLSGTVAGNVLGWGVGGLNIDACRVGYESDADRRANDVSEPGIRGSRSAFGGGYRCSNDLQGRWPANVMHDGSPEVCDRFGEASRFFPGLGWGDADEGSFLYCAKAGKRERNAGLDGMPTSKTDIGDPAPSGGSWERRDGRVSAMTQNHHPTVKPIALMRWLVRLVTPPDGTVLDPFLGSGTTAVAATLEGVKWVGCEMTEDYWPIIEGRVLWAEGQRGLL